MKRVLLLTVFVLLIVVFQACQTTTTTTLSNTTSTQSTTTSTRSTTTTTTTDSRVVLAQVVEDYLFLLENTMTYQYDLLLSVYTGGVITSSQSMIHRVDKANGRYLVSYHPPQNPWEPNQEYIVRDENDRYSKYQFFQDRYTILLSNETDFLSQILMLVNPYEDLSLDGLPTDLPVQFESDGVYKISGPLLAFDTNSEFEAMLIEYGFTKKQIESFQLELFYYHNDYLGSIEQKLIFRYENQIVLSLTQRFSNISNPVFGDVFEGYYFDIGTAADIHPYAQMGVEYKTPSTHSGNLKVILEKGVEYRLTFSGYTRQNVSYIFLTTQNYGSVTPTKAEWAGNEFRFIVPSSGVYYIIMTCNAGFRVIWEKVS